MNEFFIIYLESGLNYGCFDNNHNDSSICSSNVICIFNGITNTIHR